MNIMILRKIERERKKLQKMIDELRSYYVSVENLVKRADDAYRNGKVLLCSDLVEEVVKQLMELARDDRTVVIFTLDGKRIEIHEKEPEKLQKRKNLF